MGKRKEQLDVNDDVQPKKTKSSKKQNKEPFVDELGWHVEPPSLIWRTWKSSNNAKIAAFDLDGTIVNVKSTAQFPRNADDWKWYNKKVPGIIKEHFEDGYSIIIFSNQGGVKSALTGVMATKVKQRVEQIVDKLDVPVQVYLATMDDENRKPETGMWNAFIKNNPDIAADLSSSFFVGDAAGRPADFSDSDKVFATNVGIEFKTPEDVFGEMEGKRAIPSAAAAGSSDSGANAELAAVFTKLAEHFFSTDQRFQGAAFQKAGKAIAAYPVKLDKSNYKEAQKLQGVGKGSMAKIEEFVTTGKCSQLEELLGGGSEPAAAAAAGENSGKKTVSKAPDSAAMKFM